jgi:hypothetical protein
MREAARLRSPSQSRSPASASPPMAPARNHCGRARSCFPRFSGERFPGYSGRLPHDDGSWLADPPGMRDSGRGLALSEWPSRGTFVSRANSCAGRLSRVTGAPNLRVTSGEHDLAPVKNC